MLKTPLLRSLFLAVLAAFMHHPAQAQQKKTLTFTDLMQFRTVQQPSISDDGAWVVFTAKPDRGDSEVIVRSTQGATRHAVPQGSHPRISADSRWVAMRRNPTLAAQEAAKEDKPKRGLSLLNTATGAVEHVDACKTSHSRPTAFGWSTRPSKQKKEPTRP